MGRYGKDGNTSKRRAVASSTKNKCEVPSRPRQERTCHKTAKSAHASPPGSGNDVPAQPIQ